jgi:hypothetical protein
LQQVGGSAHPSCVCTTCLQYPTQPAYTDTCMGHGAVLPAGEIANFVAPHTRNVVPSVRCAATSALGAVLLVPEVQAVMAASAGTCVCGVPPAMLQQQQCVYCVCLVCIQAYHLASAFVVKLLCCLLQPCSFGTVSRPRPTLLLLLSVCCAPLISFNLCVCCSPPPQTQLHRAVTGGMLW